MSNKGYTFEAETEQFFLDLTGQKKSDPILKTTKNGIIQINRSFRVPGSGAMDSLAGDVVTYIPWLPRQLKIEAKIRRENTKKEGRIFRLELDWVRKNNEEARIDNQIPILTFAFKGDTTGNRVWWLIKQLDYRQLTADLNVPVSQIYVKCNTGTLSKEEDKLKMVHSLLTPVKATIWTLIIDNETYYLLNHKQFEELMVSLRDKEN